MTEWLSSASPVDPLQGGRHAHTPMPRPVRYAWCLLCLQGVIWAGLALLMVIAAVVAVMAILKNQNAIVGLAVEVFAGAVTVGFAVGTITLARALARGLEAARKTAIGVEIAMTLLGAIWAADSNFSAGLVANVGGLAAAAGASLSLAAVVWLLRRSARQYSAAAGNQDGRAAPSARSTAQECGFAGERRRVASKLSTCPYNFTTLSSTPTIYLT